MRTEPLQPRGPVITAGIYAHAPREASLSCPSSPWEPAAVSPMRSWATHAVTRAAARLGVTPAQIALAWALELAPNLLVIPGTASRVHLAENFAAQQVELDEQARRELSVAP